MKITIITLILVLVDFLKISEFQYFHLIVYQTSMEYTKFSKTVIKED